MAYMGTVLDGIPEQPLVTPQGVVALHVNPETGLRIADAQGGITDYFYQEFLPSAQETLIGGVAGGERPEDVRNQLF
jgi:membrane carboxypeptidase/penicillin-binding protein